jgi:hypothetical protein
MAKAGTGSKGTTKKGSKAANKKGGVNKGSAAKPSPKTSSKTAAQAGSSAGSTAPSAAEGVTGVPEDPQLPATHGKVGVFGGPKDRGIKPEDKLGLPTGRFFVYERVHSLNPKSFYCAMRWDYHLLHKSPEEGKRWWANKKLLITNSKTGSSIVARAVDYGPHESTGLDISVSPGAAEALGVEVGDEVDIAFADQKAPLGVVE